MTPPERARALVTRLVEIAWQGHPPSGRRFEGIDEIYVFRVEDGRLASVLVALEDNLTRLRQLGLAAG